ncbi:MAG: glycerophosphodiester phosphodiesterase [Sphaerochaetaceae bacterium]|jgi:glycerophosphoryl diester phosphodiesterase
MIKNYPFLNPMPRVVAHRGDSHNFPENTIEAFGSAVEMKVDVIETDVHLSKDGHIVIWHDETLDRNTDGSGRIEDFTLKELKKLDAGYTFSPDGGKTFPFRKKGVKLATLDEALNAFPNQRFNVDLKSKEKEIVGVFEKVVVKNNSIDKVLCASFHLKNLNMMRKLNPNILTSLTTIEVVSYLLKQKLSLLPKKEKLLRPLVFQVPVRQWGIEVITKKFVDDLHKIGSVIQVWTINDEKEMRRLFELGVDSVMTDDPATLIEVVNSLNLQ